MPKQIPKYVQVLHKEVPDKLEIEHLIKSYELDGVLIDSEMKRRNPNAKTKVICITVSRPRVVVSGSEEFGERDEKMGNWIYCGNLWYVRKLDNYEFARYSAYNTITKQVEDLWDAEKYKDN